ncbi:MAG TPA: site-2 protease family protein [Patescibacteria group bacterium]|nr:site-2 protease family protein [Patescibacteria group bacterium]
MRWSWRLGEVAGIAVYVHVTFLLLVGWVAVSHWLTERTVAAALAGSGFTLSLFGCVVLHEFGHALTARRYGIRTRDITLLPIGGVARLERMPDVPIQELWVALAGPAVNVVIAGLLFVWLEVTTGLEPLGQLGVATGPFVQRLMMVNVFLVAFNLIPAFPMDGGRMLRAFLAMRMEYTRATQVAAGVGQGIAVLFGFIGLFTNPFLLFIALFVWIGAGQEASMAQMKSALGGIPISRAMLTDFRTLSVRDSLARAVELILAGSQQDFPVVEGDRVEGVLLRSDLLAALAAHGQAVPVAEVMRRNFYLVDSSEMLETAFARLQACECHTLPVTHNDRLVGLVTMDNLGEFISIQAAIGAKVARHARLNPDGRPV